MDAVDVQHGNATLQAKWFDAGEMACLIAEIHAEQWDDLIARLDRIERRLNELAPKGTEG